MNDDDFDTLVDDATHAVNNLFPDAMLANMTPTQHTAMLYRINTVLTPVLRDLIEQYLGGEA